MGLRWLVCLRARSTSACMAPTRRNCIMHEERRWFVGIDWASKEHVVSLCDGEGEKIGQRKFIHGGTGLSEMIAWLLKASGGEPGESRPLGRRNRGNRAHRVTLAQNLPRNPEPRGDFRRGTLWERREGLRNARSLGRFSRAAGTGPASEPGGACGAPRHFGVDCGR